MSQAKKQAAQYLKRAITESVDELQDAWLAENDMDKREKLHQQAQALIGLEDKLNGRISHYTDC